MSSSDNSLDFGNDEFVDVVFGKAFPPPRGPHHPREPPKQDRSFYEQSVDTTSAPWSYPIISGGAALKKLFPNHSLVMTRDSSLDLFSLKGVEVRPREKSPLLTNSYYMPLAKKYSAVPGLLFDQVEFGEFDVLWQGQEFILFMCTVPMGFGTATESYILHEGLDDTPTRILLLSAGKNAYDLHQQIWIYDQGYWQKDGALWHEVQKADWKDVILKDEFKKSLQKDVDGFFTSEKIYKDLGIPWKRGLILYGPPGNGKTISLKAIMKGCDAQGFTPLYVKSFQNWAGEEAAMKDVFNKAREQSPAIIILEDLDSLINDRNRSFFLNQVDGLQGNDGLLLIGTTNHFDRLDPGLSTRPSRFDRKFLFDDPDVEARKLYVQYWQRKLSGNKDVDFPESLAQEIADSTNKFSFAYLKEAFVSTLVTLAGWEGEPKPSFGKLIKEEIAKLSKQLDKQTMATSLPQVQPRCTSSAPPTRPPRPSSATERDIRAVLDVLSESGHGRRAYDVDRSGPPAASDEANNDANNLRMIFDALSMRRETEDAASFRRYEPVRAYTFPSAPSSAPAAVPSHAAQGDAGPSVRRFVGGSGGSAKKDTLRTSYELDQIDAARRTFVNLEYAAPGNNNPWVAPMNPSGYGGVSDKDWDDLCRKWGVSSKGKGYPSYPVDPRGGQREPSGSDLA